MKIVFAVLLLSVSGTLLAQKEDARTLFKKYLEENIAKNPGIVPGIEVNPSTDIKSRVPLRSSLYPADTVKLIAVLPDNNKLFALPQDHMPCIVPDLSEYTYEYTKPGLPVLPPKSKSGWKGRMPNPAQPLIIPGNDSDKKK